MKNEKKSGKKRGVKKESLLSKSFFPASYGIVILFMSLAYVCISIDQTGLFGFVAVRMARAARGSGLKLFFYFFLLCSLATLVNTFCSHSP